VTAYLTAACVAPLAAHGAPALGDERPSWDRPARSALLGLVGACLGIERDDLQRLINLSAYGVAVLTLAPGRPMVDYHTVATPYGEGRWRTRMEELAAAEAGTIVTRRAYRQGSWHPFALWSRGPAAWELERIADAMRAPVVAPYIGRRSCPLALPLAPEIIDAADPTEALLMRHHRGPEARWRERWRVPIGAALRITLDEADAPAGRARGVETRRDERVPGARLFDLRREAVLEVDAAPPRAPRTFDEVLA
jgi:CRISPR system Cascade subunit CasD